MPVFDQTGKYVYNHITYSII